eukprot:5445201-Amphidinium_carterae.1
MPGQPVPTHIWTHSDCPQSDFVEDGNNVSRALQRACEIQTANCGQERRCKFKSDNPMSMLHNARIHGLSSLATSLTLAVLQGVLLSLEIQ